MFPVLRSEVTTPKKTAVPYVPRVQNVPIVPAVQIVMNALNGGAFYTTDVCRKVSHVLEILSL